MVYMSEVRTDLRPAGDQKVQEHPFIPQQSFTLHCAVSAPCCYTQLQREAVHLDVGEIVFFLLPKSMEKMSKFYFTQL